MPETPGGDAMFHVVELNPFKLLFHLSLALVSADAASLQRHLAAEVLRLRASLAASTSRADDVQAEGARRSSWARVETDRAAAEVSAMRDERDAARAEGAEMRAERDAAREEVRRLAEARDTAERRAADAARAATEGRAAAEREAGQVRDYHQAVSMLEAKVVRMGGEIRKGNKIIAKLKKRLKAEGAVAAAAARVSPGEGEVRTMSHCFFPCVATDSFWFFASPSSLAVNGHPSPSPPLVSSTGAVLGAGAGRGHPAATVNGRGGRGKGPHASQARRGGARPGQPGTDPGGQPARRRLPQPAAQRIARVAGALHHVHVPAGVGRRAARRRGLCSHGPRQQECHRAPDQRALRGALKYLFT